MNPTNDNNQSNSGAGNQPVTSTPTAPVEPAATTEATATVPAAKCKCGNDLENGNCKNCAMLEGQCNCPPVEPTPTGEETAGTPA